MTNLIKIKKVGKKDVILAQKLQGDIFPHEKSPVQIERGIICNNPINFIAYCDKEPVGIVGIYFENDKPEHALLNWFGVLKEKRGNGFGKKILEEMINYIKINLKDKLYLTYYSSKTANKTAIKLYKRLNFKTKNYRNKEDIKELKKLGVKNDFVIGIFQLKNHKMPKFNEINLHISDQFKELSDFNKIF